MVFLDFREITEPPVCASVTCAAHLRRSLGYVNTVLLMDVMTIVTVLTVHLRRQESDTHN